MPRFTKKFSQWFGWSSFSRQTKRAPYRRAKLGFEGLESRLNPVQSILNSGQGLISGLVYIDSNLNQIQDNGEPALPGINMTLSGVADDQSVIKLNTATTNGGFFTFAQLKPGTYSLQADVNAVYMAGGQSIGSSGGVAGDGTIQNIRVEGGELAFNYRFASRGLAPSGLSLRQFLNTSTVANSVPLSAPGIGMATGGATAIGAPVEPFTSPPAPFSSFSGTVYNDANNDRFLNNGESGIANSLVFLSGVDDTGRSVFNSVVTPASGAYNFAGLRPGVYSVALGQASDGFQASLPTLGNAGGQIDGNFQIVNVRLANGIQAANYLFAQTAKPASSAPIVVDLYNDTAGPQGSTADRVSADPTIVGRLNTGASIQTFRASFDAGNSIDLMPRLQTSGGFFLSLSQIRAINGGATLGEGAHTLHLLATNSLGQSFSQDLTFTLDTLLPSAPTLGVPAANALNGDSQRTSVANSNLQGSTSANSFVQLITKSNNQVLASANADAGGAFSFSNIALATGVNNFIVRSIDLAGNVNNFDTFIVRNQGPTVATPLVDLTATSGGAQPNIIDLMANFTDADFSNSIVRFNTDAGPINIEVFDAQAPQNVTNFLNYVTDGDYDDVIFHRLAFNTTAGVRTPFVLQGGGFEFNDAANTFTHIPTDPTVKNEFSTTRSNLFGTVAMAKLGGNPDSASSEFFFNLNDNSANLDNQNGGFTVFGKVQTGLDQQVVNSLAAFPVTNQSATNSAFTDLPLRNFPTGSNFPVDVDRTDLAITDTTTVVRRTEALTFTVVNNTNATLVTPVVVDNRLTLTVQAGQTGVADITVRATDLAGQSVEDTFRITVS